MAEETNTDYLTVQYWTAGEDGLQTRARWSIRRVQDFDVEETVALYFIRFTDDVGIKQVLVIQTKNLGHIEVGVAPRYE